MKDALAWFSTQSEHLTACANVARSFPAGQQINGLIWAKPKGRQACPRAEQDPNNAKCLDAELNELLRALIGIGHERGKVPQREVGTEGSS
ncbi:MAG: hypothetical protein KF776_19090 [Burkholderiales bacterium]|nr:hypothetical protein [Burkholderiales bacterium]